MELELRSYWDFNDAARSEIRFRALLESVTEPELRFEIECQIARTYGLRDMFEEAHALLDRLQLELEKMPPRAQTSYHLERGRAFNSGGQKTKATEQFEIAAKSPIDDLRIDAIHTLAIVAETPEEAERLNILALNQSIVSPSAAAQRWQGSLLNNLGWTYHDTGRLAEALEHFASALEFRIAQGDTYLIRVARWCVARCLRSMGRLDEALKIQLSLIKEGDETGYTCQELGELYRALGDTEKAKEYDELAALRFAK